MSGLQIDDVPSGYLQAGQYGIPELELMVY